MIPRLLAISDRQQLEVPFESWIEGLRGHVDAVQIREKDLTDRALYELAAAARRHAASLTVVVNGRADIALASGCSGVHMPASEVPPDLLRRRFGSRLLIGCSTHAPEEVARARDGGADYVVFGPVFATPSKERFGPPVGLQALHEASSHGLPVLAIGGVGAQNLTDIADAGAAGAAGIRVFQNPEAMKELAQRAGSLWPRSAVSTGQTS